MGRHITTVTATCYFFSVSVPYNLHLADDAAVVERRDAIFRVYHKMLIMVEGSNGDVNHKLGNNKVSR